jgi:selenocysteine lyase/cysteine desulfurase
MDVFERIRREEVGRGERIATPFGPRLVCYADQTASGRLVGFVERWIASLAPSYANSHTVISTTGRRMTTLREESRRVVRRAVGADDDDICLFVGAGATACVNKLVGLLGLHAPPPEWSGFVPEDLPPARRPLVLVGPYEHHSNQLPWAESVAEVIEIGDTETGEIDLADLETRLERAQREERPLVIGAFSAGSNVTGVLSDVHAIARVLHRHGALAFFDYAAAGPYVPIDMHPAGDPDASLDAVFLSTHKFVGGPQASGVLVCHRRCFRCETPERPGGGTVDYVSNFGELAIDYVRRLEEREEGGTPAILGDIRVGAAFLLREAMQPERIRAHEIALAHRAVERLSRHPRIKLLGPRDTPRLAILSFNIEGLHHDFVSTLLDHLFGIQNRSGCACAGPYGHRLLSVSCDASQAYRRFILQGILGIKPGWTRLTLPAYASERDVDFLLSAVEFVADHGAAFLPRYELSWREGAWTPLDWKEPESPAMLTEAALFGARGVAWSPSALTDEEIAEERARYLREARQWADRLRAEHPAPAGRPLTGCRTLDELVWFDFRRATAVPADTDALPPPLLSD